MRETRLPVPAVAELDALVRPHDPRADPKGRPVTPIDADPSAEQVPPFSGLTDPHPTHVKLGRWLLSRSNRRCNKACTRNVRYSAAQRSLTLLFCRWVRLGLGFSPKPETEPALLHSQQ